MWAAPWDTRVGTLGLQIPKVREGSYFPEPPSARLVDTV